MRLDEPPSLFPATPSTPAASGNSESRSGNGDEQDDELSTQPIADLPLFDIDSAAEETSDPDPDGGAPAADERPADHGTRPVSARAPDSAPSSAASETAPLGLRLAASCLDAVALLAVLGLLLGVSMAMGVSVETANLIFFLPTWLAFGFFYQVLPLLFWGRTPGMTAAGIESRDRNGDPLTLEQAAQRWLGGLVTWLLLGTPGVLAVTGRSFVDRLSRSRTLSSS